MHFKRFSARSAGSMACRWYVARSPATSDVSLRSVDSWEQAADPANKVDPLVLD